MMSCVWHETWPLNHATQIPRQGNTSLLVGNCWQEGVAWNQRFPSTQSCSWFCPAGVQPPRGQDQHRPHPCSIHHTEQCSDTSKGHWLLRATLWPNQTRTTASIFPGLSLSYSLGNTPSPMTLLPFKNQLRHFSSFRKTSQALHVWAPCASTAPGGPWAHLPWSSRHIDPKTLLLVCLPGQILLHLLHLHSGSTRRAGVGMLTGVAQGTHIRREGPSTVTIWWVSVLTEELRIDRNPEDIFSTGLREQRGAKGPFLIFTVRVWLCIDLGPGSLIFPFKGQRVNIQFCGLYGLCHNYSILLLGHGSHQI